MIKVFMSLAFLIITWPTNAQTFGDSSVLKEMVFHAVEKSPSFPGGTTAFYKFVSENLQVPEGVPYFALEHYVVVDVIIDPTGKVVYGKVKKQIATPYNSSVVNLLSKMPNWNPGTQNGRPVYCYVFLPIVFVE